MKIKKKQKFFQAYLQARGSYRKGANIDLACDIDSLFCIESIGSVNHSLTQTGRAKKLPFTVARGISGAG